MKYGVLYSSVGCLADDYAGPFDTLQDAAEYVVEEYERALDCLNDADHEREPSDERYNAPNVPEVMGSCYVEYPQEGSLYSWEIIELSDDEAKEWENMP